MESQNIYHFSKQSTDILDEFLSKCREIISVYFDAVTGFDNNIVWLTNQQKNVIKSLKENEPNISVESLDETPFAYAEGDPNVVMPEFFHIASQEDFKVRNSRANRNQIYIGNMTLIMIYQLWEDGFREKLASSVGVKKSGIKSDLFGDLGIIRNSILHNNSIASQKVKKCKKLKWFNPDEPIMINHDMLTDILRNIQFHAIQIDFNVGEA